MAVSTPAYCWREDVKRALDIKLTARSDWQVDRAIQSAARNIEGHLHRRFYPEDTTRYFDWPNFQSAYPWRIWLDRNELADVTVNPPVVKTGGSSNPTVIPAANILWEPINYCLMPGTRILCTDLIWRNIEDLARGDKVIGFDEKLKTGVRGTPATTLRESTVESTGLKILPCARIVLENGREIIASYDHMWVSARGPEGSSKWRKTYDPSKYRQAYGEAGLQPGDYLSLYAEPWDVQDSYAAGYLAGFMDGEGSLDVGGHSAAFRFSQNPGATLERVRGELKRFGFEINNETYGTKCLKFKLKGERAALRFLGMFRPERFQAKIRTVWENVRPRCRPVRVVSVEPVGNRTVVAIGTSTRTLIAEGFLSHNSPPYRSLQLDRSTSSAFGLGSTPQRDVSITGTFGYWIQTDPAGTLAAAVSSTTSAGVTVSDGSLVGVGALLIVDSERMLVSERSTVDSGQTNLAGLTAASAADVAGTVTDGTALHAGEVMQIDSERMLIVDVTGNTVTVKRGWDGTVLAAHAGSSHIYVFRVLTVARGQLGTAAATHSNGAGAVTHQVPSLIRDLAIAESANRVLEEVGGYADPQGEGAGAIHGLGSALADLWDEATTAYGRKARSRVV